MHDACCDASYFDQKNGSVAYVNIGELLMVLQTPADCFMSLPTKCMLRPNRDWLALKPLMSCLRSRERQGSGYAARRAARRASCRAARQAARATDQGARCQADHVARTRHRNAVAADCTLAALG